MRRHLSLRLVAVLLVGAPAAAFAQTQALVQLPTGVTLRVTSGSRTETGTLFGQSKDSVWLESLVAPHPRSAFALAGVTQVEQAQPEYPRSVLIDAAIGGVAALAVTVILPKNDRGTFVAIGLSGGAIYGILRPMLRWIPTPLR